MKSDLEKSIRGLLHQTETYFEEYEQFDQSAQASWSRYFNGSACPGDELRRIGLEMDKTYAAVMDDLMPRVGRSLRECAFYRPECRPLRTRFADVEKTIGRPSDQIRVSPAEVLIELRSVLLDALRLITERPATAESGGKNVRHRVLTVEQGTNGAEFLTPKQVAVRYNVNPKTVQRKLRSHPAVEHINTTEKKGHTPGRDRLRIPVWLAEQIWKTRSREGA
ncbi:MAG: hypothetical protein DMG57_41580 [Acidobacteria bacterium]|nr:MAG: hypothetical protein DMG57_41580 [Acidobacteriota bacterium]